MRNFRAGVKSGRLANGYERDRGKVVHVLDGQHSLCGTTPAICWVERELKTATCHKCIRRLRKELQMSELLNQIDQMEEVPNEKA